MAFKKKKPKKNQLIILIELWEIYSVSARLHCEQSLVFNLVLCWFPKPEQEDVKLKARQNTS